MRTAEEILRASLPKDCIWDDEYNGVGEWHLTNTPSECVRKAINEARIEAIKECADELTKEHQFNPLKIHSDILNLINQVK